MRLAKLDALVRHSVLRLTHPRIGLNMRGLTIILIGQRRFELLTIA